MISLEVNDNMADLGDYESLPSTSTITTHMAAGALAGVMEHSAMYPIDVVKTRMQVLVPDPRAQYKNVVDAFKRIIRNEGVGKTIRGISMTAYGAGPAHALYFASYEKLKDLLTAYTGQTHLSHGLAGCGATLLHDAVMTPADAVKQRMQVFESPYKSSLDCIKCVHKAEGARAFYRSYTTQLFMNIPFQTLHFIGYEILQKKLNPEHIYDPKSHMVSGAIAGGFAAAATTPLDVCKTLLNTQENCSHMQKLTGGTSIKGMAMAFKTVYKFKGFSGFFSGLSARVVYQMPSTAISWSVYEFFKYFITKTNNDRLIGKSN